MSLPREILDALVETMQDPDCPVLTRRNAGIALGQGGWTPAPDLPREGLLLAPTGLEPTGLDVFLPIPGTGVWMGKYPVTNHQFARFVDAGGYDRQVYWSDAGWQWRTGAYATPGRGFLPPHWIMLRPSAKCDRPYRWDDPHWNSPLFPVVGLSWFEARPTRAG